MCRIPATRAARKGIPVAILRPVNDSPTRRSLVPRSALVAAAVVVLLAGAGVAASVYVAGSRLVEVPVVTGLRQANAQVALDQRGFEAAITGQVSVDVPAGRVISQDPAAGTRAKRGSVVDLVVSVGRQTFTVPDLVGRPLQEAREDLAELGLQVEIATVSSEATSTVVLEMYPAPGAVVSLGDTVRLTVPGASPSSTVLLPFDLDGLVVAVDPAPFADTGTPDVAMDVARRLRSLLEASGARVIVTRTATDTAPTPPARLAKARASGATVLVGVDIGTEGVPGLTALHLGDQQDDPARGEASVLLADAITRAARIPGLMVNEPKASTDAVLVGFPGVGVRVIIADADAAADAARISDPDWADEAARAIYRGIGTRFGYE